MIEMKCPWCVPMFFVELESRHKTNLAIPFTLLILILLLIIDNSQSPQDTSDHQPPFNKAEMSVPRPNDWISLGPTHRESLFRGETINLIRDFCPSDTKRKRGQTQTRAMQYVGDKSTMYGVSLPCKRTFLLNVLATCYC